jgi:Tol biopolymer transport system component
MTLGAGPEGRPSIARDGSRLAYTTFAHEYTIALLDRSTGVSTKMPTLRDNVSPALAPDRSFLAFVSNCQGKNDLWLQPLSSGRPVGAPRRLTDHPGSVGTLGISPDGRWIAYHRVVGNERDIWIVPAAGGAPKNFTNNPAVDVHPSWSPDGKRLAFVSERGGGSHIWVQPVRNGEPAGSATRITEGESSDSFPAWSPDGRMIAFVRGTGGEADIWVVRPDGGPPRRVTTGAQACLARWDGGSTALLVSGSWGAGSTEVRQVSLAGGEAEPLSPRLNFGWADALGDFDVSPDGSLIVYVEEKLHGDVWTLEAREGSF